MSGPRDGTKIEDRHGFPGAVRTLGGLGAMSGPPTKRRYGFVIDHRKCIGCHACTVACKEENQVPLGAFRTWVKYVEKGTWPHTRRYFSVLRCNHCDDAPCVTICPTVALYRRADGGVGFGRRRRIGRQACLQGRPPPGPLIQSAPHTPPPSQHLPPPPHGRPGPAPRVRG